jgi:hypothetical protein
MLPRFYRILLETFFKLTNRITHENEGQKSRKFPAKQKWKFGMMFDDDFRDDIVQTCNFIEATKLLSSI